ncbi:MAG: type II toxin-antitoxin system VapC family toxin [Anaerolineae bacterium]
MGLHYFLDASAIVKYYVDEPGSVWVKKVVHRLAPDTGIRTNTVFIAEVSIAEVTAAFAILHRMGRIRQRTRKGIFDRFLAEADTLFELIPIISGDFYAAAN